MNEVSPRTHSPIGLEAQGLSNLRNVYWNLSTPGLYEEAVKRDEGMIAHLGPLVVRTGQFTGRSPNDKFIVDTPQTHDQMWWGKVNRPIAPDRFDELHRRMASYLQGKDVFVHDVWCGADPNHRLAVRVDHAVCLAQPICAESLYPAAAGRPGHLPARVCDHGLPRLPCLSRKWTTPTRDVFILVNFDKKMVLIGGTEYGGEIKKSAFTAMNYYLPSQEVMPMHCSANIGPKGDTAIFFGLSGTGKTTLSADPTRELIGDDEHGWSEDGIFNFEGGCYAKVIRLSPEGEPEIYATTRRFGTVLENVGINTMTRRLDLNDDSLTENTRSAYPLSHIPNARKDGKGGHPQNIVFLTADAFGVLPPISKLTPEQAMYHFISGYTAKVAGTERGVKEPSATFSACFGAPFMPRHPSVYAHLLGKKIAQYNVRVWMVNTGWTGGPYGVGSRMKLAYTRAMINAALDGTLDNVEYVQEPVFGLSMPKSVPGVPDEVLQPRMTWADPVAYDTQLAKLAKMFADNFKQYEKEVSPEVRAAGPRVLEKA